MFYIFRFTQLSRFTHPDTKTIWKKCLRWHFCRFCVRENNTCKCYVIALDFNNSKLHTSTKLSVKVEITKISMDKNNGMIHYFHPCMRELMSHCGVIVKGVWYVMKQCSRNSLHVISGRQAAMVILCSFTSLLTIVALSQYMGWGCVRWASRARLPFDFRPLHGAAIVIFFYSFFLFFFF